MIQVFLIKTVTYLLSSRILRRYHKLDSLHTKYINVFFTENNYTINTIMIITSHISSTAVIQDKGIYIFLNIYKLVINST